MVNELGLRSPWEAIFPVLTPDFSFLAIVNPFCRASDSRAPIIPSRLQLPGVAAAAAGRSWSALLAAWRVRHQSGRRRLLRHALPSLPKLSVPSVDFGERDGRGHDSSPPLERDFGKLPHYHRARSPIRRMTGYGNGGGRSPGNRAELIRSTMSALPPIATELVRRDEPTRSADFVL